MRNFVEHVFWAVWFSIPGILNLVNDTGGSQTYWEGFLLVGLCLSSIGYALRSKPRLRSQVNVSAAVVFFLLYTMIGYPNLAHANGTRPLDSTVMLFAMLFAIACIPLFFFIGLRKKKDETM